MTEFELSGFSCRADGSGDTLALLFSGFDGQLFGEVGGLVRESGCVLAEFGPIDWDRDYSPWEAQSGERVFSGGAERLLKFLPAVTAALEERSGGYSCADIPSGDCSRCTLTRCGRSRGCAALRAAPARHGSRAGWNFSRFTR